MIEPAGVGERRGQRVLPGMAERRMNKVVGQAQGLGQIFVGRGSEPSAADLRDAIEWVSRTGMVAVGATNTCVLCLRRRNDRVDDPVAGRAGRRRAARAAPLARSGWARPRDVSGCAAKAPNESSNGQDHFVAISRRSWPRGRL